MHRVAMVELARHHRRTAVALKVDCTDEQPIDDPGISFAPRNSVLAHTSSGHMNISCQLVEKQAAATAVSLMLQLSSVCASGRVRAEWGPIRADDVEARPIPRNVPRRAGRRGRCRERER